MVVVSVILTFAIAISMGVVFAFFPAFGEEV